MPTKRVEMFGRMGTMTPRIYLRAAKMPKGPRGEKRPADVICNAVKVMRIAVGERGTMEKTLLPRR